MKRIAYRLAWLMMFSILLVAFSNCGDLVGEKSGSLNSTSSVTTELVPALASVRMNGKLTFTVSGPQSSSLRFRLETGGGSVDPVTGVYEAPPSTGKSVINLLDGERVISSATVTVIATSNSLRVTPASADFAVGDTLSLVIDGAAPYRFKMTPPNLATVSADGRITAVAEGAGLLTVTDALGQSGVVAVSIFTHGVAVFGNPGPNTWAVPANVHAVTVKAWGGGGGGGGNDPAAGGTGGGAGYTTQRLNVMGGSESLIVTVAGGGAGGQGPVTRGGAGAGGAGGGGNGGLSGGLGVSGGGGGGGGASSIVRPSNNAYLLVAGGGGGGGGGGFGTDGLPGSLGGAGGAAGRSGSAGTDAGGSGGAGGATGTLAGGSGLATPEGADGPGAGGGGAGAYMIFDSIYLAGGSGGGVTGNDFGGGGGGGGLSTGIFQNGQGVTPGNANDPDRAGRGQGGGVSAAGAAGLVIIRW